MDGAIEKMDVWVLDGSGLSGHWAALGIDLVWEPCGAVARTLGAGSGSGLSPNPAGPSSVAWDDLSISLPLGVLTHERGCDNDPCLVYLMMLLGGLNG